MKPSFPDPPATTAAPSAGSLSAIKTSPPTRRTSLLISVRSEREIDMAIAGGADIIDLKEPNRGPLAPTDVRLWQAVGQRRQAAESPIFSAALGESDEALAVASALPAGFRFAKVGPSGCDSIESQTRLWSETRARLDPKIELVAVAYADHQSAHSLPVDAVFALAAECGFRKCLVDTFKKDGRSTLDHLGIDGLQQLSASAMDRGLWWALAGSIRLEQIELLFHHDIRPDCFGVRGDVCEQGRTGNLSIDRVRLWKTGADKCI
jgi:uncharacterized protein (UPF0264 family)